MNSSIDSDGFVPGEAVVAILLESKSVAKRSYGDLVSSVIGHDGFKGEGLTFPSREAQKEMLWDCYAKANLKVITVSFLRKFAYRCLLTPFSSMILHSSNVMELELAREIWWKAMRLAKH